MIATHRVKDSSNNTVGFIVNGVFYNDHIVKQNMSYIDNLSMLKNGVIKAKKTIPDVQYKNAVTRKQYNEIKKKNPFDRDIANELKRWKINNTNGSILQVKGTRQIGKTSEILKFAYSNYDCVIYVDLSKDKTNFEACMQTNKIKLELYKYCIRFNLPTFDDSRNTVIIIDEIQDNVSVFNSLRTLRSELKCDIIVTGSYLGTLTSSFTKESQEKVFIPMGTIKPITMFSMSFREFCRAFEAEELLMNIDIHGKSEDKHYDRLKMLCDLYCSIGGYPAVVAKYKDTQNIKECYDVISKLLSMFQQESLRYFKDSKLPTVFDLVFAYAVNEMSREKRGNDKEFIAGLTDFINTGSKTFLSGDEISQVVTWLIQCNMLDACSMRNGNNFSNKWLNSRMYFMDCGIASYIMNSMALGESEKRDMLTETFVFCELNRLFYENIHNRKVKASLCFSIDDKCELDFMFVGSGGDIDNVVFGIEIKSGRESHDTLTAYIESEIIDKDIFAELDHGRCGKNFDTIPVYTVGARFPYR